MRIRKIIIGVVIGAAIGALLECVNTLFTFMMPPFIIFLLSLLAGGCIGAVATRFKSSTPSHALQDLEQLPACAVEFVRQLLKKMRYRRSVREEVQAELTTHFEDELRDCKTDTDKDQKAKQVLTEFGDLKMLAVLMRRAKKRCRPLWRTAAARAFQAAGVLILCLIFYTIWFSFGEATINVDYVALMNRMNQPKVLEQDNAWPHYEKAIELYVPQSPTTEKILQYRRTGREREDALWIKSNLKDHRQDIDQWLTQNSKYWINFNAEQQAVILKCFEHDWVPLPKIVRQKQNDWLVTTFDRMALYVLRCIREDTELKVPHPRGPLPSSAGPGFPREELKSWLKNRQIPENFLEAVSVAVLNEADRRYADLPEDISAPLTEVEIEYLQPWISQNEAAWREFVTGSGKSYCYRPCSVDPNSQDNSLWTVLLPHLRPLRRLAFLGIWHSRIDRGQGRIQHSIENCLAVARAGSHWQDKAILIEQLVGLAMSSLARDETLRLLKTEKLSAAKLQDLQNRLTQIYPDGFPLMNMDGERMFFQDVVQRTFTDGGPGGGHLIPSRWSHYANDSGIDESDDTLLSPFYTAVSMIHVGRDATEAKAKELYDLSSKIARTTPYQRHALNMKTPDEIFFSTNKYRYFLIELLLPASARASEIAYRGKMHHEAVLTILALERWRLEKDHYPVSLNDLKAAGLLRKLPGDPYSDKSLVYKRMGDDCILYSVGPNFKDDDGQVGTVRGRPMRWGTSESGDIVLWPLLEAQAEQHKPSGATFKDQSEARALYGKMTEAIRKAETLSYESCLRDEVDGEKWYRVWMKKPNFFYVETTTKDGANNGILVGDGQYAWSYWPNGRPWFSGEGRGEGYIKYQKTRFNVYMKEPTPLGKFSISYAKILQKSNCFPVLDPSVFQGISNSLEPYIEGVRCLGVEKVGQEDCDVIEVSYMNRQRSYYFWISRRDNLPRKLEDVIRTGGGHVTREVWSKVTLNARIPMEKFRWTPPEGWKQWHPPTPEDRLLKPGRQAPDFELLSVDGGKIKLSDYRGKIVWLNFWRVGCPPCREEMPYLEKLHKKYSSKGLVVLGFDFADDRQIVADFLRQNSVTFPNIVDASEQAIKTGFMTYGARAAPVNYIIDREGKIADAWLGYDLNSTQGVDVLAKLGIK